jgi:hypothetical protein
VAGEAVSDSADTLLGVLLEPGRDFLAERFLENASEMISVLDLDYGPVLAHLL